MEAPGRIAASITIIALVCMSLLAILLTKLSRARQRKQEAKAEEEGQSRPTPMRVAPKPPQLPIFKTRSSLSMSSSPTTPRSPKTPKTPGIRFTFTAPSHRSRNSGSIDSLPSVETILEQYEQEADAKDNQQETEVKPLSKKEDLGEPGPCCTHRGR
ncbi:hypothetical protein LTR64_007244 [Lithohypha guttulata]|uniref:uncharacterized protein n=1 Tax=Lithohypha guttulata TaxID=1690604 RepID=UPI00315D5D71